MPIIAAVGFESWRQKEAGGATEDFPNWGEQADRGPAWEATTAAACPPSRYRYSLDETSCCCKSCQKTYRCFDG